MNIIKRVTLTQYWMIIKLELSSYPWYLHKPHWLSIGLPEISRAAWQPWKNIDYVLITFSNIHGNYICKQFYNIPDRILYFKSFKKVYLLSLTFIPQLITLFQITAPIYGRLDFLNSLRTSGIWKWSHWLVLWVWISLFKLNMEANTWRVFLLCTWYINLPMRHLLISTIFMMSYFLNNGSECVRGLTPAMILTIFSCMIYNLSK